MNKNQIVFIVLILTTSLLLISCREETSSPQPTVSPPEAPTKLTASGQLHTGSFFGVPLSSYEVYLSWQDNSNNEDGFAIEEEKETSTGPKFSTINTVGADKTSYQASGTPGKSTYRIKAFRGTPTVYSSPSNVAITN